MTIEEAKARLEAKLKAAREIATKAESENRDFTSDEQHDLTGLMAEAKEAKDVLDSRKARNSMMDTIKSLGEGVELDERKSEKRTDSGLIIPGKGGSLGEQLVQHDAFVALQKSLPGSNAARSRVRVDSGPMSVKVAPDVVTGGNDASAGTFVLSERRYVYEEIGRRDFVMRGLVSTQTTASDTIDYVRTEVTNAQDATSVPEATSDAMPSVPAGTNTGGGVLTLDPNGGYKPKGKLEYSTASTTVKTLAEWMPVTRRALADASQIRGLIDQKLRTDLADLEDDQILNGNGSGENLRGILQTSGIQTGTETHAVLGGAHSTPGLSDVENVSHAKVKVNLLGRRRANAVVMNPYDTEALYLARIANKMSPDGVAGQGGTTVAGLPVVESELMTQGKVLVGDFSEAILWDREQTSVTVTDSHADFFIRNLIAVLAEERVAFAVTRPKAFIYQDLTPAGANK